MSEAVRVYHGSKHGLEGATPGEGGRGGRYSVDPTPLIDETGSCLVRKISDVDEPCLDELDIVKELTGEVRVSDTKGRIGDPADTSDPRTPDPDAPTIIR